MGHCATCGWPLSGAKCPACGGDGVPLPLQDAPKRRETEPAEDAIGLDARDAYERKDWPRLVALGAVAAGGKAVRTTVLGRGPAWAVALHGVSVFLVLDSATGTLSLEAPVVRLPQRQRVAAMRMALELCGADRLARVCLRRDRLILRILLRLEALTPSCLVLALEEAAAEARRFAAVLETKLDAPPAVDDARVPAEWDALGESVRLSGVAPPSRTPRAPPPPVEDDIPAILSPAMAGGAASNPRPAAAPSTPGRPRRATLNEIQLEAASARRISVPPPPPTSGASPADQLCDLLRHAQALATALSYADMPATMLLLVRATVYRAVYETTEATRGAVAHLYHATEGLLTELWSTAAARKKGSSKVPIAEPALLAMQHVVAMRGTIPESRPPGIAPLTSAQDVKAHLAKYHEEIAQAPSEPPLLHFLALGALAEILVRTKLPAATEQRLREIVEHARRAGPKESSIDLLMKTIGRIATA